MIELLTFTGVDSETSLQGLSTLSQRYQRVEFGVLLGSEVGGIFPPLKVVEQLKTLGSAVGIKTALHLCGKYSRMVMRPEGADDEHLWDLCAGFGRVQVNLHGDWFNPERIDVSREEIRHFARRVEADRVILQHRGDWGSMPVEHDKIEYLYDVSEGGGVESFADWPEPSPRLHRMGYAGGLGPHNIGRAAAFASAHPKAALWFDMESRIRTGGLLDLVSVESVCEQVFEKSAESW